MAAIDETFWQKAKDNEDRFIWRERLEGERAPRAMAASYGKRDDSSRDVNFERLRVIKGVLSGQPYLEDHWAYDSILDHIEDGLNEELPEDVRREHYDIVGARIWAAFKVPNNDGPLWVAFQEWMKGGGV